MELTFFNVTFYLCLFFLVAPAIYLLSADKETPEIKNLAIVIYPFSIVSIFFVLCTIFGAKETMDTLIHAIGSIILGLVLLVAICMCFGLLLMFITSSNKMEVSKNLINKIQKISQLWK